MSTTLGRRSGAVYGEKSPTGPLESLLPGRVSGRGVANISSYVPWQSET